MPRENSGSIFRNDRKREGKQDADFAGSAVVAGVEYWVDMWTKPPKDGKKGFFSLSFREKGNRQAEQRAAPGRPSNAAPNGQLTRQPIKRAGMPPLPSDPSADPDDGIDRNSPDIKF